MGGPLKLYAAVGRNYQMGLLGTLPWHNPEDLKFFRDSIKDKVIVMGRKTIESMPFRLPAKKIICVSNNPEYQHKYIDEVVTNMENLPEDSIICGGSFIYEYALKYLSPKVYLSRIDYQGKADVYFPSKELSNYVLKDKKEFETFNLEIYEVVK